MIATRKSYQGITNIIRFNWHYYVLSIALIIALCIAELFLPHDTRILLNVFILFIAIGTLLSLAASWYIYDKSNLYSLRWLDFLEVPPGARLVNINAGFDETSALLADKYPHSELLVFDFYNPEKHTEVSIARARKQYVPYHGTQQIETDIIPLEKNSVDIIFLILAAHEIREEKERAVFFSQLGEKLKKTGKIIVVEHLRDLPNFVAFNFGFFHFHSRHSWRKAFQPARLILEREIKLNPFISAFILSRHGTAS